MATLSLRKNEQIELLRGVELFSGCNKMELGRIASLMTEHRAKAGQVLTKRGDPGLEFFIIVDGKAAATRRECISLISDRAPSLGSWRFWTEETERPPWLQRLICGSSYCPDESSRVCTTPLPPWPTKCWLN